MVECELEYISKMKQLLDEASIDYLEEPEGEGGPPLIIAPTAGDDADLPPAQFGTGVITINSEPSSEDDGEWPVGILTVPLRTGLTEGQLDANIQLALGRANEDLLTTKVSWTDAADGGAMVWSSVIGWPGDREMLVVLSTLKGDAAELEQEFGEALGGDRPLTFAEWTTEGDQA